MKKLNALIAVFAVMLIFGTAFYTEFPGVIGSATAQAVVDDIPFFKEWAGSAHNDAHAEAFVHWDEENPAQIPAACARCHSTPGYQDWIGADGTPAGVVEAPVATGTTIECVACHNEVTLRKTSVVMPSGIELANLGDESRCMECHQGRESTVSVNAALSKAGVTDDDTVSADLGFLNIHYYAAAATKYGTLAKGGYEYEGQTYDGNFAHVDEFDTCIECHDMHTLEVRVEQCGTCHAGVTTVADLKHVRMAGSAVDYDGDGNVTEGIYFEIQGLRDRLYAAIQAYAATVVEAPIVYEPLRYPYFFIDTNADGKTGEDEAVYPNRYASWTPRLLKAAYNYQVASKDPGNFAHGGKYTIQLLYDSIADLNAALATPVDLSAANRLDAGHFAGSEAAFRHWDENGEVPASCSKCHSAGGVPLLLKDNATISQPLANGFQCTTCHASLGLEDGKLAAPRRVVNEVEFPSGARLSFGEGADANLCIECHQGRESKFSIDALLTGLAAETVANLSNAELLDVVMNATATLDEDTVAANLRFLNIHYFAAGATLFGTEAKGAYEYNGKEYVGAMDHVISRYEACSGCHESHSQEVKAVKCGKCHDGVETKADLKTVRKSDTDFDGDGNATEGLAEEVDTLQDRVYAALQTYAENTADTDAIIYNSARYPYYFVDTNGNREIDQDEGQRYGTWTPRLLKAAYNYQYSQKDPGAYAHNGRYILQILYDTLEDLGGDVSSMTRPNYTNHE